MKIRAKIGGELNMHGPGIHWIHKANDERDFPDEVGNRILTNKNYEKASARKPIQEKQKEITTDNVVKKSESSYKKIKEKEGK